MGLSTVRTLLARGAQVAVCDINEPALKSTLSELPQDRQDRALPQRVDMTDRYSVSASLDTTKSHFGHIDGIANFGGTGGHKLGVENVWETEAKEFEFIVDLNVKGLFNVLGAGLKPGFFGETGSIVHVASMFAERGYKKGAVFAASKHAALGIVRSAAMEVGPKDIRVNCVTP